MISKKDCRFLLFLFFLTLLLTSFLPAVSAGSWRSITGFSAFERRDLWYTTCPQNRDCGANAVCAGPVDVGTTFPNNFVVPLSSPSFRYYCLPTYTSFDYSRSIRTCYRDEQCVGTYNSRPGGICRSYPQNKPLPYTSSNSLNYNSKYCLPLFTSAVTSTISSANAPVCFFNEQCIAGVCREVTVWSGASSQRRDTCIRTPVGNYGQCILDEQCSSYDATLNPRPCQNNQCVPLPTPPRITLQAYPSTTIYAGEIVSLNWNVQGSASCSRAIYSGDQDPRAPGVTANWGGPIPQSSGALQVAPDQTTTFALTCTSAAGATTQPLTINVQSRPTISMVASPSRVSYGQPSTIAWNVNSGGLTTTCHRLGGMSSTTNQAWTDQNVPNAGAFIVAPTRQTSFTLQCTNARGSDQKTVTVSVDPLPPPYIDFLEARPSAIPAQTCTTLAWAVFSSNVCRGSGASESNWDSPKPGAGTMLLCPPNAPNTQRTYTLTCTNAAGASTSRSVDVSITGSSGTTPAPQISVFSFSRLGGTSTFLQGVLIWTSQNARACTLTGGSYSSYPVASSGNLYISTLLGTPYTLTCTGTNGAIVRRSVVVM